MCKCIWSWRTISKSETPIVPSIIEPTPITPVLIMPVLREMPPIPEDPEAPTLQIYETIHDGPLPPIQKSMTLKLRESTR